VGTDFFALHEREVKRFGHAGKFLMTLENRDKKEPLEKKRNLIQGVTQNRTIDGTPRKIEVTKKKDMNCLRQARLSRQELCYF